MVHTRHQRQVQELRSKLAKALVQVERIRTGKLKRRSLTEVLSAARPKTT